MQIFAATIENIMAIPEKKLKIELPYGLPTPILCVYSHIYYSTIHNNQSLGTM